jgi:hypothetical protein
MARSLHVTGSHNRRNWFTFSISEGNFDNEELIPIAVAFMARRPQ